MERDVRGGSCPGGARCHGARFDGAGGPSFRWGELSGNHASIGGLPNR
jgi:hypothetical protein